MNFDKKYCLSKYLAIHIKTQQTAQIEQISKKEGPTFECIFITAIYFSFIGTMAVLVTPHALWALLLGFKCKGIR